MTDKNTDRILVIKHGAFGDLVQIDGALRDIRAGHPDAEIVLLTTPPFRKLMSRCPHINRILIDLRAPLWAVRATLRLIRMLRNEGFARVYDLQKSSRTEHYRKLILREVDWVGKQPGPPPVSNLTSFVPQLAAAGLETTHCLQPDVSWMADDISPLLRAEGVGSPYVALIPGCSARHPHKRWPHYPALATALLARGYDVVTAPGPDEIELSKTIPGHTLLGPNGFLNWFELAGVLRQAAFVVGNDTGPSHVAACLGTPGLALFGPHTSAERTGIRRPRFEAIEVDDLAALTPERVIAETLARLENERA